MALEELPGIERLDDLLFCVCWHEHCDDCSKFSFQKKKESKKMETDHFLCESVDTHVWLSLSFIHSSRRRGGLSLSSLRKQSEKQRGREREREKHSS